jgi:putative glycosyltransferase (TIGR04348 family)
MRRLRGGRRGSLRIALVTPAPAGSRHGNRTTALRWASLLRDLGHRVRVLSRWDGAPQADVLIALHARRSAASVRRFSRQVPRRPVILALTGTDLYLDLPRNAAARDAIARARRLVVLQPLALRALPPEARRRARVILQSARPAPRAGPGPGSRFDICVLAHLRPVKDPLRAALAARLLPANSRIRVRHAGRAIGEAMRRQAEMEMRLNPRYLWLGERSRRNALALLAASRMLVISSRTEGGANVLSEAASAGVPVIASRADGNLGLLGPSYPGLFDVGDTRALAALLARAENDPGFLRDLTRRTRALRGRLDPRRERAAWRSLLAEVCGASS